MNLAEVDRRLKEADRSYHVAVISTACFDILNEDETLTYADLELRLRALGSNTFLIALPARHAPEGFIVRRRLEEGTYVPADYYLWVDLHGEEEQRAHLASLGSDPASNLAALILCGVLVKP